MNHLRNTKPTSSLYLLIYIYIYNINFFFVFVVFIPLIKMISIFRTYVIIAPKVIHPATLYGVTITLLDNTRIDYAFISIRIVISRNDLEVISVTENVPVSSTQTFFLKVSTVYIITDGVF